MAIATELVTRKYLSIAAATPIAVDYPLFEAEDATVYYGNASLVAVLNVDYTITLDEENFDTFTLTPLASLLTKINNLIAADVTETNFIVVRRVMDYLTVTNEGAVRDTRFLSRELDRTAMRFSQLAEELSRAVKLSPRFVGQSAVIDELVEGATLIYEDGRIKAGPTSTEVTSAQQYALDAQTAQLAAETARDVAIAKENSMLRDRGPWGTGIFYSPSDTFDNGGNVYMTNVAHFATNIAADLSAGRIRLWVQKGASGSGSGDMLNSDNLVGLTNKPLAYTTIGGKAVGKVDLLPFSLVDPAAAITDVETLAANETVVNAFPVAKAVAVFARARANEAFWYPYNKDDDADTDAGLIYDFAVNGTVANIVTPDFAAGYEYRLRGYGVSNTVTGSFQALNLELFRETDAAYGGAMQIGNVQFAAAAGNISFDAEIYRPMESAAWHRTWSAMTISTSAGIISVTEYVAAAVYTAQRMLRGRISWASGSIDAGKIYMDKRRVAL